MPTTTATSASCRRRTASERKRTDAAGSTVWVTSLVPIRMTATSGSVSSALVDLLGEVVRLGADDRELTQVHPAVGALGDSGAQPGAGVCSTVATP